VTGATRGIGRDITQELCIRGFNVIVHGRNTSRLDELCELLRVDYGVKAEPLLLDAAIAFNIESAALTREKLAFLKQLNIKVVVNNVGTGHAPEELKQYEQQSFQEVQNIINVNVLFMTYFTHALLPLLKRNAAAEDPSFIINAGSLADIGLPYSSVYSGTKAYVRAYSRALDTELSAEDAHVRVVASIMGETDSDGHRVGTNLMTTRSKDMARMVLQSAAKSCAVHVTCSTRATLQFTAILASKSGLSCSLQIDFEKVQEGQN
jgi:short-subunit dehydrogenase